MGPAAWIQDVSEEAGQALDDDGTPERRARSLARLSMLMGALALSRATEGDPISDEFIAAARTALTGDRGQATI